MANDVVGKGIGAAAGAAIGQAELKGTLAPQDYSVRKEVLGNALASGIALSDADLSEARGYGLLPAEDPNIGTIRSALNAIPSAGGPAEGFSLINMFKEITQGILRVSGTLYGLPTSQLTGQDLNAAASIGVPGTSGVGVLGRSTALSALEAKSAALDELHALPAPTHEAIDTALGKDTVDMIAFQQHVEDAVTQLNETTDKAVESGAVTLDQAKEMDEHTAELSQYNQKAAQAEAVKPSPTNEEAWQSFDQADKELATFYNTMASKYKGDNSKFTAEETTQYYDLLDKANTAAEKTYETGVIPLSEMSDKDYEDMMGPSPVSSVENYKQDLIDKYGNTWWSNASSEEKSQYTSLQKQLPSTGGSVASAQTALDYANAQLKIFDDQHAALKSMLNSRYGDWVKAPQEEKDKLKYLSGQGYDAAVKIDKAQADLDKAMSIPVSSAHTALADFEGAMESKYSGHEGHWQDEMSVDETAQHDQLLNDVMTKESMPKGWDTVSDAPFPQWTLQIENHLKRPITGAEIEALKYYSSSSYGINKFVGTGKIGGYGQDEAAELQRHVDAFDSMFKDAASSKPLVIYRGESYQENWAKIKSVPVGGTFTNRAFTSSSVQKGKAKDFSKVTTGLLTIIIPQGSKAVPFSQYSIHAHEDEVLIARDTEFKVIRNDGKNIILEVVAHGK